MAVKPWMRMIYGMDALLLTDELFSLFLQVLEREQIMHKFHEVTARLEQALSRISHEDLDILEEVMEQVKIYR